MACDLVLKCLIMAYLESLNNINYPDVKQNCLGLRYKQGHKLFFE